MAVNETGGPAPEVLSPAEAARRAGAVRAALPAGGLFAGMNWRIAAEPFTLGREVAEEIEGLGRLLLQFNRSVNLLYRLSLSGRQPEWVARWLDLGKPARLLEWQRHAGLKNAMPRVIRPDLLLTDPGLKLTELDSVPGGIGLTAWLNETYTALAATGESLPLGGSRGMIDGFASIFGSAPRVHIVVSEESAAYRPEMEWLAGRLGGDRFQVQDGAFPGVAAGEAVYRFFELFDLDHVPAAAAWFDRACAGEILVTPPPKPLFEEKMGLALLWNRNLRGFWRQELGESFLSRLQKLTPYSWVVDPGPLPPHAAIPELGLTAWEQLKSMSQRERDLILKVSGYSAQAWGARGVALGSDLSTADWSEEVDAALREFPSSPRVLQRYHKPRVVGASFQDFESGQPAQLPARARLCPYYFVSGEGDAARAKLGGVLATLCPAEKKIIHGMEDAVLSPCRA